MTERVYRPTSVAGAVTGGSFALSDNPEMMATPAPTYDATYVGFSGPSSATAGFASLPETTVARFRLWFASTILSETAASARVRFTLKNADGVTLFSDRYLMTSYTRELNAFSWVNLSDDTAFLSQPLTLEMTDETADSSAAYRVLEVWLQVEGDIPESLRLKRRPLRQFPRSDGLGMSSARRQDANRSMQASLRRGGGVYF